MSRIEEIISNLSPSKLAVFVSGDLGVISLQEDLKRIKTQMMAEKSINNEAFSNANGVFLRFSADGEIFSGIVQTEDAQDSRKIMIDTSLQLQDGKVKLLALLRLPLPRIPMFPLFAVLDDSRMNELGVRKGQDYWGQFSNSGDALSNWYVDFVRFRREIINVDLPQLELAVPHWMGSLTVLVLYNEESHTIATRYYRNTKGEDYVAVEKTDERFGLESKKVFAKFFTLPSETEFLVETVSYDGSKEKPYLGWNHPCIAALKEIKEQVKRFNRMQPSLYYDVFSVSETLIHNWIYKEIAKIRELADRFPKVMKDELQDWLMPTQALCLYRIDLPSENRIADGGIILYHVRGTTDKIVTKRVYNKEEVRYNESILQQYLPNSTGKPFFARQSNILYYLRDKFGSDY